jgi:hypothetical protein
MKIQDCEFFTEETPTSGLCSRTTEEMRFYAGYCYSWMVEDKDCEFFKKSFRVLVKEALGKKKK